MIENGQIKRLTIFSKYYVLCRWLSYRFLLLDLWKMKMSGKIYSIPAESTEVESMVPCTINSVVKLLLFPISIILNNRLLFYSYVLILFYWIERSSYTLLSLKNVSALIFFFPPFFEFLINHLHHNFLWNFSLHDFYNTHFDAIFPNEQKDYLDQIFILIHANQK